MSVRTIAIVLFAATLASTAVAGERSSPHKTISEIELQRMSRAAYTELLRQAESKGHSYSPKSIANGYRRHLEELRLQLIDAGYTILVGEAGA